MTTLPYLGAASTAPLRIYRKAGSEDKKTGRADRNGDHFVIEVDLAHLGPMQFEGLIREQRFDLALRSRQPLQPELQQIIRRVFVDMLAAGGYGGEIAFARTMAFPLVPPVSTSSHREVSA
jgi:hypothetical protein